MKPQLLKLLQGPSHSFCTRRDLLPINNRWHYHVDIELIHIKKGEGTQFIGDSIKRFNHGDVALIGSNLPHYWRFDDQYFHTDEAQSADVQVAHFSDTFWGEKFLELPENASIRNILEKSKRGLQIGGKARRQVAGLLEELLEAEGPKRILLLIEALSSIAACKEVTVLSSIGFKADQVENDNDRINNVYDYSLKNFKRKIQLEEIAARANISPNSFCRYFKSKTRKTYSQFLIEVRVGYACKLLIENNLSVKQLCYESGFNNFTSFHKYFKMITGKSPLTYQKEFMAK